MVGFKCLYITLPYTVGDAMDTYSIHVVGMTPSHRVLALVLFLPDGYPALEEP